MWFWISQKYRESQPHLYSKLKYSANKVITNDLVYDMFIDLMQLPRNPNLEVYSPLSSDYILDKEPPKTLNGLIEIIDP